MSRPVDRLNESLRGRYRIEHELGEGGMAVVYLAHDLRHDRSVALKVLKPELAAVIGAERFLREIRVTAGLQHPHILPLFDSGDADGLLFYVMPFVDGESLRERLAREGPLPVADAVRILREVVDALGEAHGHGVVHRDVKPANVLLRGRHALVADFGVAKAVSEATARHQVTTVGVALGSPRYMAPEQASADPGTDHRADLFAAGVVGYEMLTGSPPFRGATSQETLAALLAHDPPAVSSQREEVPRPLDSVLMRCLEKDPAERWQSAGELLAELEALETPGQGIPPVGETGLGRPRRSIAPLVGVTALAAAVAALWFFGAFGDDRQAWARNEALPEIGRRVAQGDLEGAFQLAEQADEVIPDDPALEDFWSTYSGLVTITTVPPGARVSRRGLAGGEWESLGTTPLSDVRVPYKPSMMRVELEGYATLHRVLRAGDAPTITLAPAGTVPAEMVPVPGFDAEIDGAEVDLGGFLIDRHEVTNREYQEFVDAGGYERPELWEHAFVDGDRTLGREEAMSRFTDRTGRPGPSTWDVGSFPDGQGDMPVGGVSWHEAAAYARFVGKALPTIHHWSRAFAPGLRGYVLPVSNLGGEGPRPVGRGGMNPFGTYDMAGNVREWAYNAVGGDRYLVGGGWNDPFYLATSTTAQSPFDRFDTNGIRLARYVEDPDSVLQVARRPVAPRVIPDLTSIEPVSDEVFAIYRRMFEYDAGPLDAALERSDTATYWIRERITLDAPYRGERVPLYLYLPRDAEPPFQTVLFFPGSGARVAESVEGYTTVFDFMVKSGRAVVFPVYDGTFERRFDAYPERESALYRDLVIREVQDTDRILDYLETRDDVDTDRLGYYGYSWGGLRGPVMLALEPRFDAAVLLVAGLWHVRTLPEADEVTYTPRATKPVLMLSGRYDPIMELETMVVPMFEQLGTPPEDKKHVISDGGHFVPRTEHIRESLDWLDRYLGPVR